MKQAEQQDDIVAKWISTGFLRGVKLSQQKHVADRLEMASRSRSESSMHAIDVELAALERAGYFD
jgi:hypothetical protein